MIFNQNKTNDVKIFIPLTRNCTRNACTTWALATVIICNSFGACFVVPEVAQTVLHFSNTVIVLVLVKNILVLFVRKIYKVTQTRFLTSPHSLFHIFLTVESICI